MKKKEQQEKDNIDNCEMIKISLFTRIAPQKSMLI